MSDAIKDTNLVVTGIETTSSVAEKAGIDSSVVRRALYSGRLAGLKIGGTWVIDAESADRWIKTRRKGRPRKRPGQLTIEFMDVED